MIIKAHSTHPFWDTNTYSSPFGSIDKDNIHIGSITLNREGGKGKINQTQVLEVLQRALELSDFEIVISAENIEIIISQE